MGCGHCLQCSTPRAQHMDRQTWLKALSIAKLSRVNMVMISGGEPTDHPDWFRMVEEACKRFHIVTIATNGLWLLDKVKMNYVEGLLKKCRNLYVQVTSVEGIYPRYEAVKAAYEKAIEERKLPRTVLHDGEIHIKALGRAAKNEPYVTQAKSSLGTTSCFLSAVMASQLPYLQAVHELEMLGKPCHPLIDWKGGMHWSESCKCPAFASVYDTFLDIQRKAHAWRPCRKCADWHKVLDSEDESYAKARELLLIHNS